MLLRTVKTKLAIFCILTFFHGSQTQHGGGMNIQPKKRQNDQPVRTAKAHEVTKYMNLTVDPCKDFYDYACGNWASFNAAAGTREGELTTTQSLLEMRVNKDLQIILEDPVVKQNVPSMRKVKDFYQSCLTVENSTPLHLSFLMGFIKKHGGLPSLADTNWSVEKYNWVEVLARLRANYGLDILVGLEIDTNLHTMRGNSIYLSEPKSSLMPAELCSTIATQQVDMHDEVYETIQKEVAKKMRTWFSIRQPEANRFAGDIVRFEFELCKHMRKDHSLHSARETDTTVRTGQNTGQNRLHGNRASATQYPRQSLQHLRQQFGGVIDFKTFVDISFNQSINDQVYMRSEAYFQHLARTIKSNTKPTLANYIMYRALTALNFPTDDRSNKRAKYCVELVTRYFPKFIGEMYNRKYYNTESKNDIELLYNNIIRAFEESLKVEWLDENTRRAAKQKLAQFKLRFPLYQNLDLQDLQLERLDYWHKLELVMHYNANQELNRLYNPNLVTNLNSIDAPDVRIQLMPMDSEIFISWGLLQAPFYDLFYPNSLKFSLVGQRIARELVSAFDAQGWNHNPMSPMRWDEYTTEGFRNRSDCFRTQYSNYLHNNPHAFRNASKLRELITDSSGLNIAFNAYLYWLDTMEPTNSLTLSKETLPEVNFTNTQLFFINFAQTRCAAKHDEKPPPEFLPMDRHTPERYAVNGPLANYVEFAREFGCATGTDMNPDEKCIIY